MKCYRVDLTSLEPSERQRVCQRLDGFAFLTSEIFGKNGLEGVVVMWNSEEDFPSSPVYPNGCPFQLINP